MGNYITILDDKRTVEETLTHLQHMWCYEYAAKLGDEEARYALDVGCGHGEGTDYLRRHGYIPIGIDLDKNVIETAMKKFPYTRYEWWPLNRLEIEYDLVYCGQVLEHIEDDVQFLKDAWERVKPGGHLVVVTPNRPFRLPRGQKPFNLEHVREYCASDLREAANLAGIPNVSIQGITADTETFSIEKHRVERAARLSRLDPFRLRRFIPWKIWYYSTRWVRKKMAPVVHSGTPEWTICSPVSSLCMDLMIMVRKCTNQ